MIVENIIKIYEDAVCGSLDSRISEFILLNLYEMKQYSLGDIARTLDMPKSSAASFFAGPKMDGGYVMFQRALATDLGMNSVTIDKFSREIRSFFAQIPRRLRPEGRDAADRLADEMLASGKVIFIGPKTYRDSCSPLSSLLWSRHIPNRYIITGCAGRYADELKSAGDDTLVVMIAPNDNYREFEYSLIGSPRVYQTIRECGGKRRYLISGSAEGSEDGTVIGFRLPSERVETLPAVNLFMYGLFAGCAAKSGLDPSTQIYIC